MPYRDPEKQREALKRYAANRCAKRQAGLLCLKCGRSARVGKPTCLTCAVRHAEYQRKRRDAARKAKDDA